MFQRFTLHAVHCIQLRKRASKPKWVQDHRKWAEDNEVPATWTFKLSLYAIPTSLYSDLNDMLRCEQSCRISKVRLATGSLENKNPKACQVVSTRREEQAWGCMGTFQLSLVFKMTPHPRNNNNNSLPGNWLDPLPQWQIWSHQYQPSHFQNEPYLWEICPSLLLDARALDHVMWFPGFYVLHIIKYPPKPWCHPRNSGLRENIWYMTNAAI